MNYLFAAYSIVFIIIFAYTVLQSRRLSKLSHEMAHLAELEQDLRKQLGK